MTVTKFRTVRSRGRRQQRAQLGRDDGRVPLGPVARQAQQSVDEVGQISGGDGLGRAAGHPARAGERHGRGLERLWVGIATVGQHVPVGVQLACDRQRLAQSLGRVSRAQRDPHDPAAVEMRDALRHAPHVQRARPSR